MFDVLPGKATKSIGNRKFLEIMTDKFPEYLDLKAKGSNHDQIAKWILGVTEELVDEGQFRFYYWDKKSSSDQLMDFEQSRSKVASTFRNLAAAEKKTPEEKIARAFENLKRFREEFPEAYEKVERSQTLKRKRYQNSNGEPVAIESDNIDRSDPSTNSVDPDIDSNNPSTGDDNSCPSSPQTQSSNVLQVHSKDSEKENNPNVTLSVLWNVDDVRGSTIKDTNIANAVIEKLISEFGMVSELTVARGKANEYLGTTMDLRLTAEIVEQGEYIVV